MKKILILLSSILISFNSYGETIVCSGTLIDIPQLETFKRVGDGFNYIGSDSSWEIDYVYETEEMLVFHTYFDDGVSTRRIFKKYPSPFHFVYIDTDGLVEFTGNCKFID